MTEPVALTCSSDVTAGNPGGPTSFWRRRVVAPLVGQLKQGVTPEKLAQSMAWGAWLGIFPILGTTSMLCGIFAVALRLNHIAIQTINWLVYPLQLVLILPFLHLGNRLFGREPMSLSLVEISNAFSADFLDASIELGGLALRGIAAWTVVALPSIWLLSKLLAPLIRRLDAGFRERWRPS